MNQMEAMGCEVSLLGEDFAARVLQEAGRRRAGHRRRQQILAATAVASAIAISVALAWKGIPYRQAPTNLAARASTLVHIDNWTQSFDGASQASAMNVFFPDAMSLARFDAQYTADSSGVRIAGWVAPPNETWSQ